MQKEDILLGIELGRLEIEPAKFNNSRSSDNPFVISKQKTLPKKNAPKKETKCTCPSQTKSRHYGIHKRKSNKLLKDPVLKLLKQYSKNDNSIVNGCQEHLVNDKLDGVKYDPLNLCILVDNCNQLKISSNSSKEPLNTPDNRVENLWWKNCATSSNENKDQRQQASSSSSCSQQALNPPCDVTIDELASYFETLVHIPKKMSSMAEMMYI